MKIGIDARICYEGGYYANFVIELIDSLIQLTREHEIVLYVNNNPAQKLPHVRYEVIAGKRKGYFAEKKAVQKFEKEKFGLMLFFDYHLAHRYSGEYYVLIESLQEIFFPKKKWIEKQRYNARLDKTLEKASKVLCLDIQTALELNEKLNLKEEKIEKIPGFFPRYLAAPTALDIDVKSKHNLRGEYLIYDSGNEAHNNFERVLRTIALLKEQGTILYIIILCEDTIQDIDIRNLSLELGIVDQIIFLGQVSKEMEKSYYTQSKGVIFSSIYESFPFSFSKAMSYKQKIFANEIPSIKDIMGKEIYYLDPLSLSNMAEVIGGESQRSEHKDYKEIDENFHPLASANRLLSCINTPEKLEK